LQFNPRHFHRGVDILDQRWRFIGLVSASWLLLNYLLVVTIRSLEPEMLISLAIVCGCAIIVYMRYRRGHADVPRSDFGATLCFSVILGLLAVSTLLVPLIAWDARSIWFFHAKMIYFARGLIKEGGWTAPCCSFSHTDYPLLVPILAAQAANLAGFWNEQLPKSALVLLLVPPLAVTISYWRVGLATAALLLIIWARLAPLLTNGYMDAPLALYGLFGVLLIGSWLATGTIMDLMTGAVFVAVTLGLKNEGSLLAVTLLVCLIPFVTLASRGGRQLLIADRFEAAGLGAIVLLAIASSVSWLILRRVWGLENDLQLGISSLPSILRRLNDPEALQLIFHNTLIFNRLLYAALIGVCAIGLSLLFRTGRLIEPVFCMVVGGVYLAGIELTYLATPLDLKYHLFSSAERTTLLPALLFLAPAILLLRDYPCWRIVIPSMPSIGTN
jgi:hypothetical protein